MKRWYGSIINIKANDGAFFEMLFGLLVLCHLTIAASY